MKRGIVMEVKRKKAVILTESGQFETIRIPKNGEVPEIGDTVSTAGREVGFVGKKRAGRWLPAISMVTVILIFVVLLGGLFPSHPDKTVAAYVSYDVNPSFSAAVNGKLQVVSVKAWNQDAAKLFANRDSYYLMGLKDFSRQVVQVIAQQGYFNDQSNVLIATTVVLQDQKKRTKLQSSLQKAVSDIRSDDLLTQHHVVVSVKTAKPETRKKAYAHGLSVGKYLLYVDAEKSGLPLSISEIKQMSVSDIEQQMQGPPVDEEPVLTAVTDESETPEDLQADQSDHLKNVPEDTKVGHQQVHKGKSHQKKEKPPEKKTNGASAKPKGKANSKPEKSEKDKKHENNGQQNKKSKHQQKDKQKSPGNSGKAHLNAHHHKKKAKKARHAKHREDSNGPGKKKAAAHREDEKNHHGASKQGHSEHHEGQKGHSLPLFNKIFSLDHGLLHVATPFGEKAE